LLGAGVSFLSSLHDDPLIMILSGELDLASRADVRTALMAAQRCSRNLVIDLSALSFCDCGGVAVFLELHRVAESRGTTLRLAGPSGIVLRVLSLLRVGDLVPTYADCGAAAGGEDNRRICLSGGRGRG
jgi:anti-anti-sigma factor